MSSRVQPFQFEGLPRVPAIAVSRSRAIARGLTGASALRAINARGLGRVTLSVDAVDPVPWRANAGQAHPSPESAFMLVRADNTVGLLTVERFFALSLVRAALSAPPPPVLRPLSPSERGVLAAILAGGLAGAGLGGIRLSLERPRSFDDRERVLINVTARTAALSGALYIELPLTWLPSAASVMATEAALLLETALSVALARTELPGAAYLSAEVGDAVVFEGVSSVADDAAWACVLDIGGHRADATLAPNGELRPQGSFVHVADPPVQVMSEKDSGNREGLGPEGAAVLASAPVEVVAELGRLAMRGDEVLGLLNGTVLSLGERRRDMVTLRVGGRAWARGELVNVDEHLGVRITELLRQR